MLNYFEPKSSYCQQQYFTLHLMGLKIQPYGIIRILIFLFQEIVIILLDHIILGCPHFTDDVVAYIYALFLSWDCFFKKKDIHLYSRTTFQFKG